MRCARAANVGLMRHHDDRSPGPVERSEKFHDLIARGRVEVSGRFIGQDDLWIVDECPGHGDSLLLTAGEFRRPVMQAVFEPDESSQAEAAFVAVGRLAFLIAQRHLNVLDHAELRNEVVRLKDKAQVSAADQRERVVVEGGRRRGPPACIGRRSVDRGSPKDSGACFCPEPEAPMTATKSPWRNLSDTPRSAGTETLLPSR